MKKVLAFAASNSTKSINKQLVTYALSLLDNIEGEVLDLNDYEMPLFSEDTEQKIGQPALAKAFLEKIAASDALIISFAEHNGSYSVAYKNIFDWCSRINPKVFQSKPIVMLSTSPGKGGAASVLGAAVNSAPYFNGEVKASFSVPSFYENFNSETQSVSDENIRNQLKNVISMLI